MPSALAADLIGAAIDLVRELANKPPLTVAAALTAIHRGMDAAIDDGLAIEEAAFARAFRATTPKRVWPPFLKDAVRHSSAGEVPLINALRCTPVHAPQTSARRDWVAPPDTG
jgi:hypothetical protein